MGEVRVQKVKTVDPLKRLTNILTVSFAVFLGLIIIVMHDNPSITGYSVFSGVYGQASPAVITFVLLMVIFMYTRLNA